MKYKGRTNNNQPTIKWVQIDNRPARHVPESITVFPSPNLTPAPSRCSKQESDSTKEKQNTGT